MLCIFSQAAVTCIDQIKYSVESYLHDLWQHTNICSWTSEACKIVLLFVLEEGTGLLKADCWNPGLIQVYIFGCSQLFSLRRWTVWFADELWRKDRHIHPFQTSGFITARGASPWYGMWHLRTRTTFAVWFSAACSNLQGLAFPWCRCHYLDHCINQASWLPVVSDIWNSVGPIFWTCILIQS